MRIITLSKAWHQLSHTSRAPAKELAALSDKTGGCSHTCAGWAIPLPTTRELEIRVRVRTRQADSGLWSREHVGVQETPEMWDVCASGMRVADLGDWSSENKWKVEGWPLAFRPRLVLPAGPAQSLVYVFISLLASLQV